MILYLILIPFVGTTLGAALVFFMKKQINEMLKRILTGFAAGVMVAASIWSLIIPAMEQSAGLGKLSIVPVVVGFWVGILFLLLLDKIVPHLHMSNTEEGLQSKFKRTTKLILAVTLHNFPEGMAVGVVCAGWRSGNEKISMLSALALAIGIAIQNFPEGAIISMPLTAEGISKKKSFLLGTLSGAVEPLAAIITIVFAGFLIPTLPYLLSFAAGAMIYVVVEELIPEMASGEHSNLGTVFFSIGFTLMLILDMALG